MENDTLKCDRCGEPLLVRTQEIEVCGLCKREMQIASEIALAVAAERTRIGDEMENIVGGVGSSTAADTFHELNDYIEKLRAERATDDSDPVGR